MIILRLFLLMAVAISVLGLDFPSKKYIAPSPNAIVRLHRASDGAFFCSGTVISSEYILTAAHCIEQFQIIGIFQKEPIEIRDSNLIPTKIKASVFAARWQADVAILSGDFHMYTPRRADGRPEKIVPIYLNQNRALIACGYPWGGTLYCSPVTQRKQSFFSFAAQGNLWPGMSGGPVIDVATGDIIGVNTAVTETGLILNPIVNFIDLINTKR